MFSKPPGRWPGGSASTQSAVEGINPEEKLGRAIAGPAKLDGGTRRRDRAKTRGRASHPARVRFRRLEGRLDGFWDRGRCQSRRSSSLAGVQHIHRVTASRSEAVPTRPRRRSCLIAFSSFLFYRGTFGSHSQQPRSRSQTAAPAGRPAALTPIAPSSRARDVGVDVDFADIDLVAFEPTLAEGLDRAAPRVPESVLDPSDGAQACVGDFNHREGWRNLDAVVDIPGIEVAQPSRSGQSSACSGRPRRASGHVRQFRAG